MTLQLRRLDDHVSVAPQIDPADLAHASAAGFVAVINNRPDDEETGQPKGEAIRAAAEAAGLAYHAIPITHAGFSAPQVDAMTALLRDAAGPVLAFCRSGTRSANLWALARAQEGDTNDELIAKAGAAGYDLTNLVPLMDAVRRG